MAQIEDYSFDELIKDYDSFDKAYKRVEGTTKVPKTSQELQKLSSEITTSLNELGLDFVKDKSKVGYVPMSHPGETVSGRIKIAERFSSNPFVYHILTHEKMHEAISVSLDEPIADLLAADANSRLVKNGDSRFEEATYKLLRFLASDSIELKARKEGVPKKFKNKVRKITGLKFEADEEVKGHYNVHYDNFVEMHWSGKILEDYGFKPYDMIKTSIKDGTNTIKNGKIFRKTYDISGVVEMWKSLNGSTVGKNR